jgi:pimeloyl-ACP methyl ester carboxylesterase
MVVSVYSGAAVKTQFRDVDGLSIRYAESEPRQVDALLLNPWPESLFAFDRVWAKLAEHAHLVAVDLPGYGHTERRDDLLSPQAMGDFVVRLADAFGMENPHVVGPDVGTAASLFAAARHPGRLRTLVVGSGGTTVPLVLGDVLNDWVTTPSLDKFRGVDPREIVAGALAGLVFYQLPDAIREDYLSGYESDRMVESMRYVRRYPEELPVLRDLLPRMQIPVQIISGGRDYNVPPVNGYFLADRLPNSKHDVINAGHFTWEDDPDDYARLTLELWQHAEEAGT